MEIHFTLKMMTEFLEEWNPVMIYKIRESDLQRPTETFLTKALSSLLTAMQIKDSYTLKVSWFFFLDQQHEECNIYVCTY